MGKSPYRAALEAADEIGLAVIAITFTIIAVFVPVSFMGGIAGQYFKQFGLVVAFAVFFSLLVARLITPLLAAYFMRATRPRRQGRLAAAGLHARSCAGRSCTTTRRWRWGLLIFAGSIGSFYLLPSGFLPAEDTGRLLLGRRAAAGLASWPTRAPSTDAIARQHARAARGEERLRQRRPRDGLGQRGAQGHARHQPGAEGRAQRLARTSFKAGDRRRPGRRCRTSASGSCRTTASASSSWWSPAATAPPSATSARI